jgi:hypothetical protein
MSVVWLVKKCVKMCYEFLCFLLKLRKLIEMVPSYLVHHSKLCETSLKIAFQFKT